MTPAERHRDYVLEMRADLLGMVAAYPSDDDTFVDRLLQAHLEALLEDLDCILSGICPEDPARLLGQPMGMYHCPTCACMVVAGVDGHPHEDGCLLGLNKESS